VNRPVARFAVGAVLGFLSAISIVGGMFLVFVPAVALVCLAIALMRSVAALAGALCAFGLTWVLLIGSTYMRCQSMGPDCVMGGGELVFVGIGALLLLGGVVLSALLLVESRQGAGRRP